MTPHEADVEHGCLCWWEDDYLISRVARSCPIGEHRAAFWWAWRARWHNRLAPFARGARVAITVLTGRPRLSPADLVVLIADPLLMGGEMLIVGVTGDNRLVCEAVHYEQESEDDAPPRGVFWPHELELAHVWARQAV